MVCSFSAQVRRAWSSKTLAQNVGARARFSAGIRVSSPEVQKEIIWTYLQQHPHRSRLIRADLPMKNWAEDSVQMAMKPGLCQPADQTVGDYLVKGHWTEAPWRPACKE